MLATPFQSAKELAAGIRRKKIGCLELLDLYLSRMEKHNPSLNAVIVTDVDGARAEQSVDNHRVARRDVVLQGGDAPRARHADDVEALLDRHRHAVQRPPYLAPRQRPVGRTRAGARALEVANDDGIQGTVVLFDPGQVEVQQLQAADLFLADVGGELLGGAEGDIEHDRPPRSILRFL